MKNDLYTADIFTGTTADLFNQTKELLDIAESLDEIKDMFDLNLILEYLEGKNSAIQAMMNFRATWITLRQDMNELKLRAMDKKL